MKFISDPKIVSKTPIITTILLEFGNIGQLYQMWSRHLSSGQSLWSWVSVNLALWLWLNFYRVICPKEKFALYATVIGIVLNSLVILSIIYFRVSGRG